MRHPHRCPVLVDEVHAATGPGHNVYACPAHAPRVPVALTPAAALAYALSKGRTDG
ncbi:hypothetical protein [Streptomyces sp. NPDC000410]|uniref:hypothetical protein n=1 Tax=Streptomyces sp. NPDC000410 TaxID=3154254 RepID=UPI00332AF980